jgi:hypothetical protein
MMADSWDTYLSNIENKASILLANEGDQPVVRSCKDILPHASNVIEWAIDRRFLNVPSIIDKFVRQYEILRDTFQLRCPVCNSMAPEAIDCWGKSRMELESETLLVWSEDLKDDVCPKCRSTRQELVSDGMLEIIDTMVGVAGMRSGKSVLAGVIGSYFEHELYHIGDIHSYFGVLPGDPLQISFVATTATQAEETVYAKYRALRADSPWIRQYVAWVKKQEKEQKTPLGMKKWAYKEDTDSEVYNGLIDLSIKSLNSNSAGLAGATRVAAFVDELSRFDTSDSKRSADEIIKVMGQGLKTVRGSRDRLHLRSFWGLLGAISSPISAEDKTMVMVKQKVPGQYSFHYATWDFNPDQPRHTFDNDFRRDPVGAQRDFGAQPPKAETPFIDDEGRFRQAIAQDLRPVARFEATEPEDKTGRKYVGTRLIESSFDARYSHYLHFDAGASFDTFAGASAHGEWVDVIDPATGDKTRKFITVIDWVLGIQPVLGRTLAEKRIVWFESLNEVVQKLTKTQKIAKVTFDRWNSEKMIQDIRGFGVIADYQSIKAENFMQFLRDCYEGSVKLLPPRMDEPDDVKLKNDQEKAIYELLRLERSPDLKKIYNPKKGQHQGHNSDDLAHAIVGVHVGVQGSVVAISDGTGLKDVLRREQNSGAQYYGETPQGKTGGRVARGRSW